jgi:hypothetical protein
MKALCRTLFLIAVLTALTPGADGAWEPGTHFRVGTVKGRPCLIAPDGKPFRSVGMVWAYGPERGPLAGELTVERLTNQLAIIKQMGFNTLNLYGDCFVPEMLAWCDENELAVYFRTSCYSRPDFPGELKEFPDFMDDGLRQKAAEGYRKLIAEIRDHPSVLALDMDHRWLFPLDWGGHRRYDTPKLRPHAVAFFPKWLEARYGDTAKLNGAWGTQYASFADILNDPGLLKNGEFLPLTNHPARVDVYRYTLWTPADFLKDLAHRFHAEAPDLLITPTTEHPECIPETNPKPGDGIAFMSPVHYNTSDDFRRDMPGLSKLIYETRWHYDLQGGPVYISETGWRTDPLEQRPPSTVYAWTFPPDEEARARAYAEQFALLNVLPWIGGYGYFMLFDKWAEGNFGYLNDDGTKRSLARVGDAMNGAFSAAVAPPDPEPQVWIYYPDYAQASRRPGFQQLKTFVNFWEKPFLDALERRVAQNWDGLRAGDRKAGRKFAAAVTADFRKRWRGFAFTTTLPADDRPILLFSTISEILSREDRATLLNRKTVTFGPVGLRDEFMRDTDPWYLHALQLDAADVRESFVRLSLSGGAAEPLDNPDGAASPWALVPSSAYDPAIPCRGETIPVPPGRCTRIEFLAASTGGDAAPDCAVAYAGGARETVPMGPTISDLQYPPAMTEGVEWSGQYLSRIRVPLDPGRAVEQLILPDAPWVRLYGMVLVSGGAAERVRVTLPSGVGGETDWMLLLREEGHLNVLERFATGDPAIVAAGPHVAYLYDPLNWGSGTNEISRLVDLHRKSFDAVLKYLRGVRSHE